MDIRQEIIDNVIYGGNFNKIRGLIADLDREIGNLITENVKQEDFTGASFWMTNNDQYEVAYSNQAMVMNKNGTLHGVAKFNSAIIPSCSEDAFSLGDGALALSEGML